MAKPYIERNIVTVMQQLRAEGTATVSSLDVATRLSESRGTVGRYLNRLVDMGRLNRLGSGRATRYELAEIAQWLERRAQDDHAGAGDSDRILAAYQAYEAARSYAQRLKALLAECPRRRSGRRVGVIVVTPDSGAHARYAANVLGVLAQNIAAIRTDGLEPLVTTVGELATAYCRSAEVLVTSSVERLYTASKLEGLIGALKTQSDDFLAGRSRAVFLVHANFVRPGCQEVVCERLLPIAADGARPGRMEPALRADLVRRYVEGAALRSVCETLALEATLAGRIC